MTEGDVREYTRREWLTRRAIMNGSPPVLVQEAVSTVALAHPEWDMDGERRTLAEWETGGNGT
jgi:hypothetical protein